jgi:hypothetical protein
MPISPANIDAASLLERPPGGAVRVLIDTDAANEIDDLFAVASALLSPERIELEALYAAPFHNPHSTVRATACARATRSCTVCSPASIPGLSSRF